MDECLRMFDVTVLCVWAWVRRRLFEFPSRWRNMLRPNALSFLNIHPSDWTFNSILQNDNDDNNTMTIEMYLCFVCVAIDRIFRGVLCMEWNKILPNWTYILISFGVFVVADPQFVFSLSCSREKKNCYAENILNAQRVCVWDGKHRNTCKSVPNICFSIQLSVSVSVAMSVAPIHVKIRGFSMLSGAPSFVLSFVLPFIHLNVSILLNGISNRPLSPVWCASKYRQLNSQPHRARACVCVSECANEWMYERSERAQD